MPRSLTTSRNDNALSPSLRGEAEAIQPFSPSLRGVAEAIHKQKELESKIDSLVYTLYNLTDDEIATIDSKNLQV